jgi:hypothetical protein
MVYPPTSPSVFPLPAAALPEIGPATLPYLLAGIVLAWLALRVWILRNRLALREPGEAPPRAAGWLLALARARATMPLLLLGIVGCATAVVLVSR